MKSGRITLIGKLLAAGALFAVAGLATAQRYAVLGGHDIRNSEAPWLFDGKQVARGIAISVSDANTEENRKACAGEWKGVVVYRGFCTQLSDLKIIAVHLSDMSRDSVTLVPVSRIARVSQGDEVLVRMADLSGTNAVKSLPVFLRVLPKNNQGTAPSLLDFWRRLI